MASAGRTKRAEAETAAMRVVVHISSNRYGSLASCCSPLAAVIPPRVAATRAFFPDTRRCEFPPSRRLGSASLFTELCLMKTVCLARRPSPIAACGRIASESISLAVTSGTRSRRARVRSCENTSRPDISANAKRTFPEPPVIFPPTTPGCISGLSLERFLGTNGQFLGVLTTPMSFGRAGCTTMRSARFARGPSSARGRRPSRRRVAVVGSTTCASRGTARREGTRYVAWNASSFRGVVVRAPRRMNIIDPAVHVSTARSPFHLASSTTHRRSPAPRAPPPCASSRRMPRKPAPRASSGASSGEGKNGSSRFPRREAARRKRRARVSSAFQKRA